VTATEFAGGTGALTGLARKTGRPLHEVQALAEQRALGTLFDHSGRLRRPSTDPLVVLANRRRLLELAARCESWTTETTP
jgi:hypothetical protein